MKKIILFTAFIFCHLIVNGQTDDNIIWASINLKGSINESTSFKITPIFRFNDQVSDYQNSSIDLAIKRKLGHGLSLQFISRTWFVPKTTDRQFLWFDLIYNRSLNKIGLASSIRLHYAIDIAENKDSDFIRWKTRLNYPILKNLSFFGAIEPWLRLNGFGQIQRIRYETGFDYDFNNTFGITLGYRREENISAEVPQDFNHILMGMIYKL